MKPLVCVRHEEPDHLGTAADVLDARGIPIRYVDAWRGSSLPDPDDAGGIVVLGGVMNVDQVEEFPFLLQERRWLRRAVEAGVPVLGICLGGQLLARALGAPVTSAPAPEIGFFPVRRTPEAADDPLFSVVNDGDRLFQWHEDAFRAPGGAELLLTGDDGSHEAFRAGGTAWGVQFHPEVTPELLDAWLDTTPSDVLSRRWGRTPDDLRSEATAYLPDQQDRAREVFGRFAALVAEAAPAPR